jgi:hypothetical protein
MTPEERKGVLQGLAHWIRHGEGFPPSGGRMVWAEAIEDSVDADARADRLEAVLKEIEEIALQIPQPHKRAQRIILLATRYKEASCLKP